LITQADFDREMKTCLSLHRRCLRTEQEREILEELVKRELYKEA
jgi:hypothetical protein